MSKPLSPFWIKVAKIFSWIGVVIGAPFAIVYGIFKGIIQLLRNNSEQKVPAAKVVHEEIKQIPLEYNDEYLFPNDIIHPLFVQVASVITEAQKCNYTFLRAKLGLPRERVNEIIPQLIKYGIIAEWKKDIYWKVLIHNEIQLQELIDFYKGKQ